MVLETWQLPQLPGLSAQNIKRGLDIVLTLMILTVLLPLFGGIALGIRLTSKGPLFYKSLRIGKNYQPFYMWKFRTMFVDADQHRNLLRQQAGLHGQLFKLIDDPRVTRFGRFLRKFSLDELPQLFNVLEGNMSLVGPRPLPPDESELFRAPFTRRFDVLPGITGLWQISGRSNLRFEDMCQLEFTYVSQWQLVNDLKILFQTVPAVLYRKGAY
jgi:lipopolysaccharide/colanic/teichoic acid biosynthesis glycosyltransferase